MKKIGMMFVMAGVLAFGLSSCGDDNGGEAAPTPTVDWKGGVDYVSAPKSVSGGTQVKFGINASGTENLTSVGVRISINGGQETILPLTDNGDSTIKTKNFSMDIPYTAPSVPGTVKFTVIVKMSNSTQTSKSILLTITNPAQAVTDRQNIEMGAQNNATFGSFWDLDAGIMMLSEANATPGAVDFIYYYGASNKASFASPNDAQVTSVFASISNWSTRNATKFRKTTLTASQYDAITMSTDVDAQVSAGVTVTSVTDLKVGDVVLFVKHDGSIYGLIKVTEINPASSSGAIKFDMKIVG